MWAIYWTPLERTSLERVKVKASSFSEALDKAAALIPEDARIIDCEPVGK
jgi:hypothetical protein